ncbi:MAG: hypothetical protein ABIQ53_06805 [Terracoccus sp.]
MVVSLVVGGELAGRTLVGRTVGVSGPASELVQPDRATPASAAATTMRRLIPLIVPVAG